jgi:hypothetical protein
VVFCKFLPHRLSDLTTHPPLLKERRRRIKHIQTKHLPHHLYFLFSSRMQTTFYHKIIFAQIFGISSSFGGDRGGLVS